MFSPKFSPEFYEQTTNVTIMSVVKLQINNNNNNNNISFITK